MTTFKQLSVGDTFDFIDPSKPSRNSFFERCVKTGPRTYECAEDEAKARYGKMRVGTVNVEVFNVQ